MLPQQQASLMKLLQTLGDQIDKSVILEAWKKHGEIGLNFVSMSKKKKKICQIDLVSIYHRIQRDNELEILRRICLSVLWNILNHPTKVKYRQLDDNALYSYLKRKCTQRGVKIDTIAVKMERYLQQFGFQKESDNNWYYSTDVQILRLWQYYEEWVNTQTRSIPKKVCMLKNGRWRDYEILLDYEYRRIMLLDVGKGKNKLKVETLQVGNPKKSSLEFNVCIEWYNDSSTIATTCTKWFCVILNDSWHFRTETLQEIYALSDLCSVKQTNKQKKICARVFGMKIMFNSFHVVWKDRCMCLHKEPCNPYWMTLRKGLDRLKKKYEMAAEYDNGAKKLIAFENKYEQCNPVIPLYTNENMLLHDIYKNVDHYPKVQVSWKIIGISIIPYKCTKRIFLRNIKNNKNERIDLKERPAFNPFLYKYDLHKLKPVHFAIHTNFACTIELKQLLHEIITNGYLLDLISKKLPNTNQDIIKQRIRYNEQNPEELVLNDNILTILQKVKILYHNDVHKYMGYPLQLHHICAILLYCNESCNAAFSFDQMQFKHEKWKHLDIYLYTAIQILHRHERREENVMELYCGLKGVRLENIENEIKVGFFISYVQACDNIQVARISKSNEGCILHFHPSMRRANIIFSCDMSWISPCQYGHEILFARSFVYFDMNAKAMSETNKWNAKVESEDKYTQMILLTWTEYDQFIQHITNISIMHKHKINLNLIYISFKYLCDGDMNKATKLLREFKEWKLNDNNKQKYKDWKKEFVKHRCCDRAINLFHIFLTENGILRGHNPVKYAAICTASNGLPYVENDKKTMKKGKRHEFIK
ncbi:hypothetical protein RFI_04080 [Reticulomyxa filosa]|uniref:C2H2-type domain-containing protein n=1 Tax=Reticulomyxa filosa TaxID=46433 RepID=X6P5Y4_RETFI|nr:hypothetical protein RFI_04080 [Reticulomyxa filosa]|eukprot:ETO33027.1 hypothetical protein RFI_04080 [Reticulomyxa filosa]